MTKNNKKTSPPKAGSKAISGGRRGKPKAKAAAAADSEIIKGQQKAAKYASVSMRTIRRWVKAGMPRTEEGHYFKKMLDFYAENEGNQPTKAKVRKEEASADKTKWQAEKLKLELDLEQGTIVRINDEYIRNEVKRHMAVNRALHGLTRTVAARLPEKIRRIVTPVLKEEVNIIVDAFAEGRPPVKK